MTDLEHQQMILNLENDLKSITENEKYLLYKFRKLSVKGKENVILSLNLSLDLYQDEPKIVEIVEINDRTIFSLFCSLPNHISRKMYDRVYELFQLEPSYKGKRGKIVGMYKRLSPLSKRNVSNYVNKLIEEDSKAPGKQEALN